MCLLAALFKIHPDAPIIVAANRDELLERPATAMAVLRAKRPRILGGRDLVAGGTWLAVNELGVFAALTNRPSVQRDPSKRSRGEWPLFLARCPSAREAVDAFIEELTPADFSPGWVFAGDPEELYYVDMTSSERGRVVRLDPGVHILENRPLESRSAKAGLIRTKLDGIQRFRGEALTTRLTEILGSHDTPAEAEEGDGAPGALRLPPAARAACVHLGPYGTRSATIVRIEAAGKPRVWSSDGPPCTSPLVDVGALWTEPSVSRKSRDRA